MEKREIAIILDAGHGVNTPGKCSPDKSIYEWKYARDIVERIKVVLNLLGIETYIVHPEDQEIKSQSYDLKLRVDRANAFNKSAKARGVQTFYISVHLNASKNVGWGTANGWTCYTSKGTTKSDKLSACFYQVADKELAPYSKKVRKFSTRVPDLFDFEEDFYVLKYTNMPAVLTENFFMDNESDLSFLKTEDGKNAIVSIHVQGILEYISKYN